MKNYNDIYDAKQKICTMIDTIYSKSYDKAYEDGRTVNGQQILDIMTKEYQKGLDDAWECAKKICLHCSVGGYTHKELRDIFTESSWEDILKQLSASEAIAKIKEYEEKKKADDEIQVGDEVLVDERRMIVLGIDLAGWRHLWCPSTGFVHSNITTYEMTKTGRHFDIENMIEQMKGN